MALALKALAIEYWYSCISTSGFRPAIGIGIREGMGNRTGLRLAIGIGITASEGGHRNHGISIHGIKHKNF
jgi:hypothetical protein